MKKTNITVSYDEEKAAAIRLYMEQKNVKLEEELVKAMDSLYAKNVPAGVRDFIDMRSGMLVETSGQKGYGRKEKSGC